MWIDKLTLLFDHAKVLAEHGGGEGVRDEGLLESALARPRNLHAYEGVVDLNRLAACYCMGIVRNHPFIDGNKRVGFVALALFLSLNGFQLKADQVDAVHQIYRAADGTLSEAELTEWVRQNARKK